MPSHGSLEWLTAWTWRLCGRRIGVGEEGRRQAKADSVEVNLKICLYNPPKTYASVVYVSSTQQPRDPGGGFPLNEPFSFRTESGRVLDDSTYNCFLHLLNICNINNNNNSIANKSECADPVEDIWHRACPPKGTGPVRWMNTDRWHSRLTWWQPVQIEGVDVEVVNCYKYLNDQSSLSIPDDKLDWSLNTDYIFRKGVGSTSGEDCRTETGQAGQKGRFCGGHEVGLFGDSGREKNSQQTPAILCTRPSLARAASWAKGCCSQGANPTGSRTIYIYIYVCIKTYIYCILLYIYHGMSQIKVIQNHSTHTPDDKEVGKLDGAW